MLFSVLVGSATKLSVVHEVSIYHAQLTKGWVYLHVQFTCRYFWGLSLPSQKIQQCNIMPHSVGSMLLCAPGVSSIPSVSVCQPRCVSKCSLCLPLCPKDSLLFSPMCLLCFQWLIVWCGLAVCVAVSVCVYAYVPFPVSTWFKVQVLCQCVHM